MSAKLNGSWTMINGNEGAGELSSSPVIVDSPIDECSANSPPNEATVGAEKISMDALSSKVYNEDNVAAGETGLDASWTSNGSEESIPEEMSQGVASLRDLDVESIPDKTFQGVASLRDLEINFPPHSARR